MAELWVFKDENHLFSRSYFHLFQNFQNFQTNKDRRSRFEAIFRELKILSYFFWKIEIGWKTAEISPPKDGAVVIS